MHNHLHTPMQTIVHSLMHIPMYLCYALSYACINSNIFVNLIYHVIVLLFVLTAEESLALHSTQACPVTTPPLLQTHCWSLEPMISHAFSIPDKTSYHDSMLKWPCHTLKDVYGTSLIAEVMKLPSLSLIQMMCSLMMHFLLHWPSLTFTWLQWSTLLKQPTDATFSMMSLDLTDCQNWNQNWTLCSTHK